ncbi:MAG: RNA 2',3'-cyclic phosphodiesterase [Euryarchaeota archaeon]|nr:RNA 2',3'-cyclic phosphodiesterase [Euryarchaeota archaeon]
MTLSCLFVIDTMAIRTFIAVDLERDERIETFGTALKHADPSLKIVNPSLIHITLKFLGDVEEGQIPKISEAMHSAVQGVEPFTIAFRGTGAFPSLNRIRVVWVGMIDSQALGTIARRLDERLATIGFARETRPFAPHLTVARARSMHSNPSVRRVIQDHAQDDFGQQEVRVIRLKKSVLTPHGPQYSTLEELHLS